MSLLELQELTLIEPLKSMGEIFLKLLYNCRSVNTDMNCNTY